MQYFYTHILNGKDNIDWDFRFKYKKIEKIIENEPDNIKSNLNDVIKKFYISRKFH
jgi:hypothetical protein